ncbi:TMV resistance protein N-like [Trifolium medium]|uniref:TMV resistance protein N-like n=1 Tax=Trifolium medium TaxID=97028 RepID=A0A392PFT1_9FABA|nr:TMV resistance protein N-like [Trifolium medium]
MSCEDCEDEHLMAQAVHGLRRITIVKWYGIHVYREENRMEDVLLTSTDKWVESNERSES